MPISGHCHTLYTPQLSITLTGGVRTLETVRRDLWVLQKLLESLHQTSRLQENLKKTSIHL